MTSYPYTSDAFNYGATLTFQGGAAALVFPASSERYAIPTAPGPVPAGPISAEVTCPQGTLVFGPRSGTLGNPVNCPVMDPDGCVPATFSGRSYLSLNGQTSATVTWWHTGGAVYMVGVMPVGPGTAVIGRIVQDLAPEISLIYPVSGDVSGGTLVQVAGQRFGDATSVTFDGTAGTGLSVASDALIEVTSPAHAAGAVDVTVTTPDGTDTLTDGYTFTAAGVPTITSATPTEGPTTGGTSVLLVGTDLAAVTGVTFGGTTVAPSTVLDTAVIATSPPGAEGVTTLTVTDGTDTSNELAWEYTSAPPGPAVGDDLLANLVALLADQLDGVTVASRRPATDNLGSDPTVVVRLTGGQLSGVIADNPTVTVEAWAPTTVEASALLRQARNALRAAAHEGRSGLRRYREFAGPADLPDPDTTNPRHTLTASLVTRADF